MEKSGYLLRARKTVKTYKLDEDSDGDEDIVEKVEDRKSAKCQQQQQLTNVVNQLPFTFRYNCTPAKKGNTNNNSNSKNKRNRYSTGGVEKDPDFRNRKRIANNKRCSMPSFNAQLPVALDDHVTSFNLPHAFASKKNNDFARFVRIEPAPAAAGLHPQVSRYPSLKCVVDGCDGRDKSNPYRSALVYPFPASRPVLMYLWKKAVRKKNPLWSPGSFDGVCANHFMPYDRPWLGDAPSQHLPAPVAGPLAAVIMSANSHTSPATMLKEQSQMTVRPNFICTPTASSSSFAIRQASYNTTGNNNNNNRANYSASGSNNKKPVDRFLKVTNNRTQQQQQPMQKNSYASSNGSNRMIPVTLLANVNQTVSTIIINARPYDLNPCSSNTATSRSNDVIEHSKATDSSEMDNSILPAISVSYDEDDDDEDELVIINDIVDNKSTTVSSIDDKNRFDDKVYFSKCVKMDHDKLAPTENSATNEDIVVDNESIFAAISVSYDEDDIVDAADKNDENRDIVDAADKGDKRSDIIDADKGDKIHDIVDAADNDDEAKILNVGKNNENQDIVDAADNGDEKDDIINADKGDKSDDIVNAVKEDEAKIADAATENDKNHDIVVATNKNDKTDDIIDTVKPEEDDKASTRVSVHLEEA